MNRAHSIEAERLPNGSIIGHAIPATWYVFGDGVFSVHVAVYEDGSRKVIRSDNRTWPSSLLKNELADYVLLRNATPDEAMAEFGNAITGRFEV